MKKRIYGKKLSRSRTARLALYRALVDGLFEYGKIKTTLAKARGVQGFAEKLILIAQKGDLASRRRVLSKLANKRVVVDKVFAVASKIDKKSGFTKITPLVPRKGDAARICFLEIVNMPKIDDKKDGKKVEKNVKPPKVEGTKGKKSKIKVGKKERPAKKETKKK